MINHILTPVVTEIFLVPAVLWSTGSGTGVQQGEHPSGRIPTLPGIGRRSEGQRSVRPVGCDIRERRSGYGGVN